MIKQFKFLKCYNYEISYYLIQQVLDFLLFNLIIANAWSQLVNIIWFIIII